MQSPALPTPQRQQRRMQQLRYSQAVRNAQQAAAIHSVAGASPNNFANRVIPAVQRWVKKNSSGIAISLVSILLFLHLFSLVSGVAAIASQVLASFIAFSYTAEDAVLVECDLLYSYWEAELEEYLRLIEIDFPGFSAYHYDLDVIGHDRFELFAYLNARYQAFDLGMVQDDLRLLFEAQYSLELKETVNHILSVNLFVTPLSELIPDRLDEEQFERYALLVASMGTRQVYGSPLPAPWGGQISSYYGYRWHPINGGISLHRGLDIAAYVGTEITAIHDGKAVFVQMEDSGDFGMYVVIEDASGLRSVYAHCSRIAVVKDQEVKMGEIIAEVGNTGLSTGPHLHLELLWQGEYLNPLLYIHGY